VKFVRYLHTVDNRIFERKHAVLSNTVWISSFSETQKFFKFFLFGESPSSRRRKSLDPDERMFFLHPKDVTSFERRNSLPSPEGAVFGS